MNPRFGIASHKSLHDGIFRPWLSLFASTISRTVTGMDSESFSARFKELRDLVDTSLAELLEQQPWPDALRRAISYSLMAGGKRLRPALVLMGCQICGGNQKDALPAAHAVEMIHTYSLIHDDLPCMDDDDLRRGRPTSHRVFGDALATLAGDALQTLAFETLGNAPVGPAIAIDCVRILSSASGGPGMVGGQILDLEAERGAFPAGPEVGVNLQNSPRSGDSGRNSGLPSVETTVNGTLKPEDSRNPASTNDSFRVEQLIQIHKMKTGALMTAALELGSAVASATADERERLKKFGQNIGLAFQIADDLLDVTGSDERLGKETGRDNELGKLTYPSLIGIDASRQKAITLVDEACVALDIFDDRADVLRQLARFIVERDH